MEILIAMGPPFGQGPTSDLVAGLEPDVFWAFIRSLSNFVILHGAFITITGLVYRI